MYFTVVPVSPSPKHTLAYQFWYANNVKKMFILLYYLKCNKNERCPKYYIKNFSFIFSFLEIEKNGISKKLNINKCQSGPVVSEILTDRQ